MGDNEPATSKDAPSFKTFWKTSTQKPLSFIQHDPSGKGKGKAASRSDDGEEDSSSSSKPIARRQQIYRAQKLHRQRKAEYIKHLEAEVADLRKRDSSTRREKLELEMQNLMIRDVLGVYGISSQLESPPSGHTPARRDHSPANSSVSHDVSYDPSLGAERLFAASSVPQMPSIIGSTSPAPPSRAAAAPGFDPGFRCSSPEEYFNVLDFILGLEHVCREHVEHPAVYTTSAQVPPAEGHILTTSTHDLGEPLELHDEMTPVQAWQTLRMMHGGPLATGLMTEMKTKLAAVVKCSGYGAVIKAQKFWEAVKDVSGLTL